MLVNKDITLSKSMIALGSCTMKLNASTEMVNPDFVTIAKGYRIRAKRVEKRKDLDKAVKEMIDSKEPFFLEICVEKEDNVFPMIPSGASVSDIRLE